MPRYQHPGVPNRLSRLLNELHAMKETIDSHEPIAGENRANLQEASSDLHWGLIMMERALLHLHRWIPLNRNASQTLPARLKRSRRKHGRSS